MRIQHLEYFRAISILFIVAGHSFHPWPIDTIPEKILANVVSGGSALFVFLSGFFFHHVFYPDFHYRNFLIKKIKNVLLPYIVLTVVAFVLFVVYLDVPRRFLAQDFVTVSDGFELLFQYLITGRILTAYWYVPFIMLVFALSPIFVLYINLSKQKQICIFSVLLLLSMVVHRPSYGLSPTHSVVYFLPIYLLGITSSVNYKYILQFIHNKCLFFGSLTIALSVIQVVFYGTYGDFSKGTMLSYNGLDVVILQKICMIFFMLSVLQKIDSKEIAVLSYIASISFSIYFIHPFILHLLSYFLVEEYVRTFIPGGVVCFVKILFVISVSILFSFLFKAILGNKSRYIVGS
ncbi:putative acyltransferase [Desulfocapsa sulfexigens DSM 10523]|uniref:Putative acyltransferase n=1 Tax=Desulfocapsa sulfexigens (strain DSM 10523 / SB164P1) TaxID=1167006 RepID=M1PA83_DESSD|nr:acyltransferase [Desulfocapsa sulfexigens]AGF78542.1 putative acyltransferase [Desulfocapsa sulfexigens DSM 10523]